MNKFDKAVNLSHSGMLKEAKTLFEEILLEDPRNPDVLYNLGMCFSDLNQPEKAIVALKKSIEYNPDHSNSYVALGYAYNKIGKSEEAKKSFFDALKLNPDNSYAMRNLGGIFGKSGQIAESLYYLKKSYEINSSDAITIYGLGYCYQQIKDYNNADIYYRKILEIDAPSHLKELAKNGLRELALTTLKSKGFRIDVVMYMLSALKLFEKDQSRIQGITFEIALKGRSGFDINNPNKKYTIQNLPGEFTGLQLVSYMYVGFKKLAPDQDIGMDLSQEYEMALKLFHNEDIL
jgi:tetratricopeptide (TPR) repeat protein